MDTKGHETKQVVKYGMPSGKQYLNGYKIRRDSGSGVEVWGASGKHNLKWVQRKTRELIRCWSMEHQVANITQNRYRGKSHKPIR